MPDVRGIVVVAAGAGALEFAKVVHDVAGTAGDVGVILATGLAVGAVGRRVMKGTRAAWDDIRAVRQTTDEVPPFMAEQREINVRVVDALETLTERADSHERMLGVLAASERDEVRDKLRRAQDPPSVVVSVQQPPAA